MTSLLSKLGLPDIILIIIRVRLISDAINFFSLLLYQHAALSDCVYSDRWMVSQTAANGANVTDTQELDDEEKSCSSKDDDDDSDEEEEVCSVSDIMVRHLLLVEDEDI